MPATVKMAFESESRMVPLESILPLRRIDAGVRKTVKYLRIAASITELGIIEPLVVYPQDAASAGYLLLDGHIRFDILKERGETEALCLISTDDEAFTYNHKVNQVSPIQEHLMILKAIESGVSEERIAATLNVDVARIRQKRNLLSGVCPEAVELLKEKRTAAGGLREFKKVTPMRQIEMAELMIASNNFTGSYAKCLVAATPQDQLTEGKDAADGYGLSREDASRLEREMGKLGREFKLIEESYGRNVLTLVVYVAYVKKFLRNGNVTRFLSRRYPEILAEFEQLIEAADLTPEV